MLGLLPPSLLVVLLGALHAGADPATLPFEDCFSGNATNKMSVNEVYGQVLASGTHLNLTVIGSSGQPVLASDNNSSSLSTLFTTTSVLTLSVYTEAIALCNSLRPQSPLPALENNATDYCPVSGPFALSASVPWGRNRELTTLQTRLRAVDPFSAELLCITVDTTPLSPTAGSPYGVAHAIFWATVALAIAYWVVIGTARIVSAWGRGILRERSVWAKAQSAGFILASAISGERFSNPALLRFSTPCMRDVIFHTQWCAVLAMVAVQWPAFIYPLLSQTAWAALSYNVTFTANDHWNPLSTLAYAPPSAFRDQFADSSSPLYIDPSVPNLLFTLPSNASSGIPMFAYTVGVRPQDLFGIAIILFLGLLAATIALSCIVWFIDFVGSLVSGAVSYQAGWRARSPGPGKDIDGGAGEDAKSSSASGMFRPASRMGLPVVGGGGGPGRKRWYRVRSEISSFHWSVLHGNLVRILVLFHLPLTIFAVYQMSLPASVASVRARALAGLSFALVSILVPAILVVRVTLTTTNKLYDETRTLLALGPLYNHYRHGSQLFASLLFMTNLVFGIVIGGGQKSGTAQAIVILVVEVGAALVTSVWLPWGRGASMGLISFLFCVARIVVAVLLVILTPAISIGDGAGAWVAYGILVILALVYLALVLMLFIKLVEAFTRIIGRVGFDRSSHAVDGGLLGACGLLGCCGSRSRSRSRAKRRVPQRQRREPESESTYAPPAAFTDRDNSSTKKGSLHSQPPSVLRPEHALRPYREDSDDDADAESGGGYIMGAWQPFPRYAPMKDGSPMPSPLGSPLGEVPPPTPPQPQPSSGFSRVGGGRAHIDTPYAITPGAPASAAGSGVGVALGNASANASTPSLKWPAMERERERERERAMSNAGMGVPMGMVTAAPPPASALPKGAMLPHMRTKSQTAIIENAPMLVGGSASGSASGSRPPSRANALQGEVLGADGAGGDDEDADELEVRKRRPWYHIRRHRPHSDGATSLPAAPPPPPSAFPQAQFGEPAEEQPTRSFVVIRKGQGAGAGARSAHASSPTPFRGEASGSDVRNSSATG
ncbi:Membrane protein [Mycena kentingensis (nom. inval.)]|nr:Membrane protein [Mycena kentingensis (nom. inval.)]